MSRCEHGLSTNVFGDLENVCMTCISPKQNQPRYLVSKKKSGGLNWTNGKEAKGTYAFMKKLESDSRAN